MKTTGAALGFSGFVIAATGGVCIIIGSEDIIEGAGLVTLGIPLVTVGGVMLIGGLVLNSIGVNKMNEYGIKIKGLKVNAYSNFKSTGLVLTYNF